MIHINFSEPDTEEWRTWRSSCDREQRLHNRAVESGIDSKVKTTIYKGQKDTYIDPEGPFHGKCAYCESGIYTNQHIDIEHFRPKDGVNDENTDEAVTIKVRGSTEKHPGYYWLAYDWKNLLPCCIICNRPSKRRSAKKIGKHSFFPVEGFRATRPGEEEQEKPLLIHPVFDNPEEHIEMDELGILTPKSESERGKTCIAIFGLNERDLPNARKKVYKTVKQKMSILCSQAAKGDNCDDIFGELRAIKEGFEQFSFAARKAIMDSEKGCEIKLGELTDRDSDYAQ